MKRRTTVKILSFCTAAVLAAAGFAVKSHMELRKYRLEIQNGYSRSLDELGASVNNISLILEKAEFATTPKHISNIANKLLIEAENAKSALAQLPAGGEELTVLNRFLSQVGNYAVSVAKSLASGGTLDNAVSDNMAVLRDTAQKVALAVSNSQITYNNLDYWAEELDRELDGAVDSETLAGSLGELEESLSDYPKLVYDGPYSDHILEKEPAMIKDAEHVSESEALETAAETAGVSRSELASDGLQEGSIPAYRFSNSSLSVTVSRSGGYAVYMRKSRTVGDSILSYEQALDKAKRYLERIGMKSFCETYYFTDEGVCVINFAYLDGKTICYTDLVKVGVAMDSGEIMLYEASGYLTNHTERAFETPAVTEEKAAEIVSPKLKIRETALALIPTESGGEVRCYEFVCVSEAEQDVLVYINAVTLEEEDILILLKSDGGTLVK